MRAVEIDMLLSAVITVMTWTSLQVGGLGDVVTGLARACRDRGHTVEVMLPYYESLPEDQIHDLHHVLEFECPKVALLWWY